MRERYLSMWRYATLRPTNRSASFGWWAQRPRSVTCWNRSSVVVAAEALNTWAQPVA